MSDLGPLAAFEGTWEGNVGVDVSFAYGDRVIGETTYFERARFRRIPVVHNGSQTMHGLNYQMTAWRHGEEAADPFHDEVGYMLWEESTGTVMRCFAVPRGIAVLMGATATPDADEIHFRAEAGAPTFGLVQNPHLLEQATCGAFETTFGFGEDGSLTYKSDLTLTLAATGGDMQHTDTNTLHRVDG